MILGLKKKRMWLRIAALFMVTALMFGCLAGCSKKEVSYKDCPEAYEKTMKYHDGFTILQLTDIHWNGATQIGNDYYGSRRYLKKVIDEAVSHTGGIDLIEVTGDTFMLANTAAVLDFIDFMSEVGIPYAIGWGNHDRQGTYNPNWISKRFLKAPYSLYTEVDNDDVHERANYVINLIDDSGAAKWQLINIDSGASLRDSGTDLGLTYDYIRDDQFEWMTYMHDRAGSEVPAICYYHISQGDNDIAYEAYLAGNTDYKYKFFKCEGFAVSKYTKPTEDIFLANNVKAAFMGHDHNNDWTFTTPSGIVYGLGVKTGEELYYTDIPAGYSQAGITVNEGFRLSGATLVTLTDDQGSFSLEHLYLNEREDGDFVRWEEY